MIFVIHRIVFWSSPLATHSSCIMSACGRWWGGSLTPSVRASCPASQTAVTGVTGVITGPRLSPTPARASAAAKWVFPNASYLFFLQTVLLCNLIDPGAVYTLLMTIIVSQTSLQSHMPSTLLLHWPSFSVSKVHAGHLVIVGHIIAQWTAPYQALLFDFIILFEYF